MDHDPPVLGAEGAALIDVWSLSHGRDGYHVTIHRQPRWARAVAWCWDRLCGLTRGWIGGHGLPGWAWRIPVGRARWDRTDPDEPWLENSLAGRLDDLCNWFLLLPWRRDTEFARFPIHREMAKAMYPDFVADMDAIDAEIDDDA